MHIKINDNLNAKELNLDVDFDKNNMENPIKQGTQTKKDIQNENSYAEICDADFDEDISNIELQTRSGNTSCLEATKDEELNDNLDGILDFVKNNSNKISKELNNIKFNSSESESDKKKEADKKIKVVVPLHPEPLELKRIFESANTKLDKYNINEVIENSIQGKIGDCWLLAGLNSLSYSSAGSSLIKNAIENEGNGKYSVYFKGVDVHCTITDEELDAAKSSGQYSKGDDDVLLVEVATEKFLRKLQAGEINLPQDKDTPEFLYDEGDNPLDGGFPADAMYLFTGKAAEYKSISQNVDFDIDNLCNKIEGNDGNYAACIHFKPDKKTETETADAVVKDIYGDQVTLTDNGGNHSWSIKEIKENCITMVNPWNSSKEVTVSKNELERHILGYEYLEL